MIYLQSLSDQTRVFLQSFGFGFLLGIVYDAFRIVRIVVTGRKKGYLGFDLVYVVVCSFLSFLFFLTVNDGKLRGYAVFALLLGWLVYYFSLGSVVMKLSDIIIGAIRRIVTLMILPIKFINRKIKRLFNRITTKIKRILKKVHKKSKFHLKFNDGMVYNLRCIMVHRRNGRND